MERATDRQDHERHFDDAVDAAIRQGVTVPPEVVARVVRSALAEARPTSRVAPPRWLVPAAATLVIWVAAGLFLWQQSGPPAALPASFTAAQGVEDTAPITISGVGSVVSISSNRGNLPLAARGASSSPGSLIVIYRGENP